MSHSASHREPSPTVGWVQLDNGIVVVTLPSWDTALPRLPEAVLARLEAEIDQIAGVVVTSVTASPETRPARLVRGDRVAELIRLRETDQAPAPAAFGPAGATEDHDGAGSVLREITVIGRRLRRLERLGRPVVAAVNGSAVGGGLGLALACHHRIVADGGASTDLALGFPEVNLGLLPAAGSLVRTVALLGLFPALTQLLLEGQPLRPADALRLGLVHEVVPAPELIDRAITWIIEHPDAAAPWDTKGFVIPGGTAATPALANRIALLPAAIGQQWSGAARQAPAHIAAAAVESTQVDLDTALAVESRYFVELITGTTAGSLLRLIHDDLPAVAQLSRPSAHGPEAVAGPEARPQSGGPVRVIGTGPSATVIADALGHAGYRVENGGIHADGSRADDAGEVPELVIAGSSALTAELTAELAAELGPDAVVEVLRGRGPTFVTSRLAAAFVAEVAALRADGVAEPSIRRGATQAGFVPALIVEVCGEPATDSGPLGGTAQSPPDRTTARPPGMAPLLSLEDVARRLLAAMSRESARCLDEGAVASAAHATIASVLGAGLPASARNQP
jgi:3-hydroxyacyl-CoA dehydrogenase/enoyl-CoA hydratase/3-hydroxybutyryl-CoA epimerase